MPHNKKSNSGAKANAQQVGHPSTFQQVFNAWRQGKRILLLQLWDCHVNRPIPLELHDIIRDIIEQASLPTPPEPKRKPGRQNLTTRYHDETKRAEIVRTVNWLLKMKPSMTKTRARELAADLHKTSDRLVKEYCLERDRRLR